MDSRERIRVQVKGFLTPIFTEIAPDGRRLNGLDAESFERVRAGFACPECLAMFSGYTITCPICKHERDVAADVQQAPDLWNEHLREREEPWIGAKDKPRPFNPLEAIAAIAHDTEVDQVSLKKLMPSKHGRGRPK